MSLEYLQSLSDAELNELSAVKVMGWERKSDDNRHFLDKDGFRVYVWNPTSDMNDAMTLLSVFRDVHIKKNHSGGWIVSIGRFDEYDSSLPRAITIASILAKEALREDE